MMRDPVGSGGDPMMSGNLAGCGDPKNSGSPMNSAGDAIMPGGRLGSGEMMSFADTMRPADNRELWRPHGLRHMHGLRRSDDHGNL